MGMFDIINKMNKLNSGEKVKLTYAEVCNIIINVQDANKNLTKEQFNEFYKLFKEFQKAKTTEYEVDMKGYFEMCYDIITKFDKIAPYEKYSGASEIETSFLMDEIRRIEKERNAIKDGVKDVLFNDIDAHQNQNKDEFNQDANSNTLNQYRTADIKRLLIEKANNLPESDYLLYGNMFEIIANLIDYKVDNQTMVDAFDELSDLILGKIPSFMAIVPKEQRLKIQIRYMNEKGILQELTDEEKEAFAYCVWHATCIVVADEDGNMNSGLIDFDSVEHIKALYEEDKSRQPGIFPSNESLSEEKTEEKDFGFDIDNPIHTTSVSDAYVLLKSIYYEGEEVNVISQAAIEANNGHLVDLYNLTTNSGKKVDIYIDSYCDDDSNNLPNGFSYIPRPEKSEETNENDYGLCGTILLRMQRQGEMKQFIFTLKRYAAQNNRSSFMNELNNHIYKNQRDKEYILDLYKGIENELINWFGDRQQGIRILDFLINSDPNRYTKWGEEARQLKEKYLEVFDNKDFNEICDELNVYVNSNDIEGFKHSFMKYYKDEQRNPVNSVKVYEQFSDFIINKINDINYDLAFFDYHINKKDNAMSYATSVRNKYYTKPLFGGWKKK